MRRVSFARWCLVLLALAAVERGAAAADAPRPNIVLIMADDMGYSDLGCYGGEIRTPNLDRLAAGGVRFTQFYNTARCCPTRAALMTGLYSHQAGIGHMTGDDHLPGYRGDLNRHCVTIAEVLRPAGYRTYMAGKWHVTRHVAPEGPKDNWPLQRGFDRYYGMVRGGGSYFDPISLTRDNTQISPFADPEYQPEQYYFTDAISDHAVRFIRDHERQHADQPFFMYVAYTAAHWPMHARDKDIAKYRGRYGAGYGSTRQARFERMKQMGLVDADWQLSPQAGQWDSVKNKEWEARCMEVYAAMVDCMDQGIGRITQALADTGRLDNTLILFLQDNGGCAEDMGRQAKGEYMARPDKPLFPPMKADALQPDMVPKQTRDGYPVVMGPGILPGTADTFIAYGEGWANVSNTPFRLYKHWVHEGGISTPLIAHWPATIKRGNGFVRQPSHLIDIMATCVDLAGADYPTEVNGRPIHPAEGASLRPLLEGAERIDREPIFWEHEGNRAVRDGRWKLVAKFRGDWELYDIDADRTEQHNLASANPEKVREMAALYDQWAARAKVVPWQEILKRRQQRNRKGT